MTKVFRLSCAQGRLSLTDIFNTVCYKKRTSPTLLWRRCMAFFFADYQQSSMQILRNCFSVPRLSAFLPFHLLLFCKCRGLQKTVGAEDQLLHTLQTLHILGSVQMSDCPGAEVIFSKILYFYCNCMSLCFSAMRIIGKKSCSFAVKFPIPLVKTTPIPP